MLARFTGSSLNMPQLQWCQAEGSQSAECEGAQFENQVPAIASLGGFPWLFFLVGARWLQSILERLAIWCLIGPSSQWVSPPSRKGTGGPCDLCRNNWLTPNDA